MDEGFGALIVLAVVIGVIVAIVKAIIAIVTFIVIAIIETFVWLSGVFGHPGLVIAALVVLGAIGGIVFLRRRQGAYISRSSHDFATIANLKLTPEGWSTLVLLGLLVFLVLYGTTFVAL